MTKSLEKKINQLPPEVLPELEEFVGVLLARNAAKQPTKLRQNWAGALRDYRDQYTSLELQEKALQWRGD